MVRVLGGAVSLMRFVLCAQVFTEAKSQDNNSAPLSVVEVRRLQVCCMLASSPSVLNGSLHAAVYTQSLFFVRVHLFHMVQDFGASGC